MKFFYCAAGPEGEPVLMIRPQIREDVVQDIKHRAQQKVFAQGVVIGDARGLIFQTEFDIGEQLEQDLQRVFSKKVSALQNARVVPAVKSDDLVA
ncbi:MAG: hypothetical protein AAFV53_38800 [Myxococcota bacterium]